MFEVQCFHSTTTFAYIYTIRADFDVPGTPTGLPPKASELFPVEKFVFTQKFSISEEWASSLNINSVIGRNLREAFLKTFEPMKDLDVIHRAMKYMADIIADDGFTVGLLMGQTLDIYTSPSKKLAENEYMKSMIGGIKPAGGVTKYPGGYTESEFAGRARRFSMRPPFRQTVTHPVTIETHTLRAVIMDLNDNCGWSREQIADWLETLDIDIKMQPREEANV